jgi:hypothetical protein
MRRLVSVIILSLSVFVVKGQNNTNSPYSIYGIGELEYTGGGRNMGMGGSGIALRSDIFLNSTNPASLTAIPQQSLSTDLGINFKLTNLKNQYKSANVLNGNISWATLAFPISRTLAASLSLNPKSSVGYTIYSRKGIEGTDVSYPVIYKGEGGLSEAAFSFGVLVTKKLSMGVKGSILWGNMTKNSEETPSFGSAITRIDQTRYSGIYFKSGFQYQSKLNEKTVFTLGGILESSSYLRGSSDLTINSGTVNVISETKQESQIRLPLNAGLGMALEFQNKYLLTFDYERSDWKNADLNLNSKKLDVNNVYHLGLEIAPKNDLQHLGHTAKYRIGGWYQTGYLDIYGTQISSYAATCGISVPIRKDRNSINLAVEAGRQGTMSNQLIRETYVKLNCSFTLWEHWFSQRKFD